jgi:hypothetical protein
MITHDEPFARLLLTHPKVGFRAGLVPRPALLFFFCLARVTDPSHVLIAFAKLRQAQW